MSVASMFPRAQLLFLVLLAHTCVADRFLFQSLLDCSGVHPSCTSCVVKRSSANGLVQDNQLVCKGCISPAYRLFEDESTSTCACSPGYYARPDSLTTCEGCGRDHWCPGGVGAAAQQNACGSCLMTVTTLAQDSAACVTQAGCGYQTDGSGSVCRIGTYSAGSSQQPCTPCPSGLTTVAARSESVAACMAPPGYIFQAMQALPCPKGTYKEGINRASVCTPCPKGISTAGVASSSGTACDRALPGYKPVRSSGPAGAVILTTEPCPKGTYGPDGLKCITCNDNLTTQGVAHTSPADCLAPPGMGYYKTGKGDDNPITTADLTAAGSKVFKCPTGSFKAGWNLNPCKSCGSNVLTDTNPSDGLGLSADQCYIPPGWGASFNDATKQLVAYKCNNGTFGVAERTYGIDSRPCRACPAYTVTPDQVVPEDAKPDSELHASVTFNAVTSMDQCSTIPGYGWEDGSAVPCTVGYYAPGYDNQACVACGQGLTTAATMAKHTTDCIALPGWEKANPFDVYAVPCAVGSYSAGGANVCQKCALGSSTQYTASHMASQCSVCAPGWGFNAVAGQCTICESGTFSPGGSDGPCIACADGQVSATGSTSSDDCFDEFVSIAPYDYIETPISAWQVALVDGAANNTVNAVDCREACRTEERCQYWLFKAGQDDPRQNGCTLKLAPRNHATDTYTAFKLTVGDYTIFEASDDEYEFRGKAIQPFQSTDGVPSDPWRCLRGCDKEASCMGTFITKVNGSWTCWFVRGAFGLGSTASSLKANPGQINTYYWTRSQPATAPEVPAVGTNDPAAPTNMPVIGTPVNVPTGSNTTSANSPAPVEDPGFISGPNTPPNHDELPTGSGSQAQNVSVPQLPINATIEDPMGFIPHSYTGLDGGHSTYVPPSPSTEPEVDVSPAPKDATNSTTGDVTPTGKHPTNPGADTGSEHEPPSNPNQPAVSSNTSVNQPASNTPVVEPSLDTPTNAPAVTSPAPATPNTASNQPMDAQ